MFDLTGKTALVTGGASGLGRMISEGFLRAGARVLITSRREAREAAEVMSPLGDCIGIASSLADGPAFDDLQKEIERITDELHIVVNNAGRTWGAPIDKFPDDAWPKVMSTNVQAPFSVIQRTLPLLESAATRSDPARVINIGSAAGIKVQRLNAFSYGASKAALHHLSRELAAELASRAITVNTVVPGYFPTKMTSHIRADDEGMSALVQQIPLGRLGAASDIAGACLFLSSEFASYITGSEIRVDGGLTGCT